MLTEGLASDKNLDGTTYLQLRNFTKQRYGYEDIIRAEAQPKEIFIRSVKDLAVDTSINDQSHDLCTSSAEFLSTVESRLSSKLPPEKVADLSLPFSSGLLKLSLPFTFYTILFFAELPSCHKKLLEKYGQ